MKKEKTEVGAIRFGSFNPVIHLVANPGLSMPDYAQKQKILQCRSVLTETSIKALIAVGFWRDDNDFHRQIIEKRCCSKCQCNFHYEGYSNLRNYFALGICQKCFSEVLFPNLSDVIPTISTELIVEIERIVS